MTHILNVTSSPRGDASYSNRVRARALDDIRRYRRDAAVVVHDFARDALHHLDEDFFTATHATGKALTAGQRAALERPSALIDELLAADAVVTAAAMINSGIPSILKAWIDHICRAGRTFSYGEGGAKGFVSGKQVTVVVARGGIYSNANKTVDFQLPYLRNMLALLGMTEVVEVEGTAFGPEVADKSVVAAFRQLNEPCTQAVAA